MKRISLIMMILLSLSILNSMACEFAVFSEPGRFGERPFSESLYERMGLSQPVTLNEIKSRYRRLAHEYHPDRHQSSPPERLRYLEEAFKSITLAYKTLRARLESPTITDRETTSRPSTNRSEQSRSSRSLLRELQRTDIDESAHFNLIVTIIRENHFRNPEVMSYLRRIVRGETRHSTRVRLKTIVSLILNVASMQSRRVAEEGISSLELQSDEHRAIMIELARFYGQSPSIKNHLIVAFETYQRDQSYIDQLIQALATGTQRERSQLRVSLINDLLDLRTLSLETKVRLILAEASHFAPRRLLTIRRYLNHLERQNDIGNIFKILKPLVSLKNNARIRLIIEETITPIVTNALRDTDKTSLVYVVLRAAPYFLEFIIVEGSPSEWVHQHAISGQRSAFLNRLIHLLENNL